MARRRATALVALAGVLALGAGVGASANERAARHADPPARERTERAERAARIDPVTPAEPISVFPMPGSRLATPKTQIVFRGVRVSELGRIAVWGSRSGVHGGRLLADSDGLGGSYVPTRPFSPGELVTVRLRPHLLAHGTSFSFRIATPAGPIPVGPQAPASRAPGDVLSFRSRPDLTPAAVEILEKKRRAAPGDIFLAPEHGPVQSGPMILDPSGGLIWFHPLPAGKVAADFAVQSYEGRRALTWWQGYLGAGVGAGEDVIFNSSYRQIATVHAANGLRADLHEFLLIPGGKALITAYQPVIWNASSVHGSARQIVLDAVVQEIDIRTGLLLFQWDSLDHVPLTDSYQPLPASPGQPYDYFHINSIQRDTDGDLIVSARNTWAAYKIDPRSGRIVWTLGGKHSTFKVQSRAAFAFQHNVRVRGDDDRIVTLFDDGAGPPTVQAQSRAITLRLDPVTKTATLLRADDHTPPLSTNFEGDVQELPNEDQFVGWGAQPYFSEFDSAGQQVFDGRFVGGNTSYRAYRFQWTGTPVTSPAIAASTTSTTTTVYASWNGATDVSEWQVLSGTSPNALRLTTSRPKHGFETQITIPAAPYVAVLALDAEGRVLSASTTIRAHRT